MELEFEKRSSSLAITKLYNATLMGDLSSLLNLLEQDPLILDRCMFEKPSNYIMQSPLHVAASKGYEEIFEKIVSKKPDYCFLRDQDGMNPIHIACIGGHINVIKVVYERNFHALREPTNGGETILHLCVKHNQLKALQMLLELTNDGELLNSKDNNGNTILHLAVTGRQVEIIKLILKQTKMEKNRINNNGLTALDCLRSTKDNNDEILACLADANTLHAQDVLNRKDKNWVENQSQSLMVVASLIAGMAFQVILSPPGGFWQDTVLECPSSLSNTTVDYQTKCHAAGTPVAGDYYPWFNQLVVFNSVAIVSSLLIILLLISGLRFGKYFVEICRITMWISVTATMATYSMSWAAISWNYNPGIEDPVSSSDPINISWKVVVAVILFARFLHYIIKFFNNRPSTKSWLANYLVSRCSIKCPPRGPSSCLRLP